MAQEEKKVVQVRNKIDQLNSPVSWSDDDPGCPFIFKACPFLPPVSLRKKKEIYKVPQGRQILKNFQVP